MQNRKHQPMRRIVAMAFVLWGACGTVSQSEDEPVLPEAEQRRLVMGDILASARQNLSGDLWLFRSPITNLGDEPVPLYELICGEGAAATRAGALDGIDDAMAWNYGDEETLRRCESIALPSPDEAVCGYGYHWDYYDLYFRRHDDGWRLFVVVVSASDPDDPAYWSLEQSWLDDLLSDVRSHSCEDGPFIRPAMTRDEIRALRDAYEEDFPEEDSREP